MQDHQLPQEVTALIPSRETEKLNPYTPDAPMLELLARPKMLLVIGLFILIVWGASKLPDSVYQWFTENSGIWSIGVFVIGCIAWGLSSNRD